MNKNNKDKYQKSFNALHLSDDFREKIKDIPEESGRRNIMNFRSAFGISRVAAAIAAAVTVVIGSAGVCYACDVGGIRTSLNLWINGEYKTFEASDEGDGSYVIYDENGEEQCGMGGIAFDEFGNETPMSAEELAQYMNNDCHLEFGEDGSITFYYKNIVEDVTDLNEDGNIYIHVADPSNDFTYFHIYDISDHGYSSSSDNKPEAGKDYYEVDASNLEITDVNNGPAATDDALTYTGTFVIDDDEE